MKARGRVSMPAHWREEWTRPAPNSADDEPETFFARLALRQSVEGEAWGRWKYVLGTLWRNRPRRLRAALGGDFLEAHREALSQARQAARQMRGALLRGDWREVRALTVEVEAVFILVKLNAQVPHLQEHQADRDDRRRGNLVQQKRYDQAVEAERELVERVLAEKARLGRDSQLSATRDDSRLEHLRNALTKPRLERMFPAAVVPARRGPTAGKGKPSTR